MGWAQGGHATDMAWQSGFVQTRHGQEQMLAAPGRLGDSMHASAPTPLPTIRLLKRTSAHVAKEDPNSAVCHLAEEKVAGLDVVMGQLQRRNGGGSRGECMGGKGESRRDAPTT